MSDAPQQYTLVMHDAKGNVVSTKHIKLVFDGRRPDPNKRSSYEEYHVSIKGREMYRDAAYAAGKWPWKQGNENAE